MNVKNKWLCDKKAITLFFIGYLLLTTSILYFNYKIKEWFGLHNVLWAIIPLVLYYFIFSLVVRCLYNWKRANKNSEEYYYHTINNNKHFEKISNQKYMYSLTGGRLYISNIMRSYNHNIKLLELCKVILNSIKNLSYNKCEKNEIVSQNVFFFDKELGDKFFEDIYPKKYKWNLGYLELWMLWKYINNEFVSSERKDIKFSMAENVEPGNINKRKIHDIKFLDNTPELCILKKKLRVDEILLSVFVFYYIPIFFVSPFVYLIEYYDSHYFCFMMYIIVNFIIISVLLFRFLRSCCIREKCVTLRDNIMSETKFT
ncbi:TPA: hypothetical protein ACS7XE_002108 [Providencia alcalifaciens]